MKGRFFLSLIIAFLLANVLAPKAYAVEVPSFPACANPPETVKVSYDNGTHGVPGLTTPFTGKDTVFIVSGNDLILQCLCPTDGEGIQTNWWKISNLTQDEINILTRDGWIFVPSGSAWGLDDDPYLAKNLSFSCKAQGEQGGVASSSTTSSSPAIGGPAVLGLATTGNSLFILAIILAGSISLLTGLGIKTFKKK